jgi:hypothetical protein
MSGRSSTYLAGVVLAAALVVFGAGDAAAEDVWRARPPIPQGANEVIGAVVGDQLLVYGGQRGTGAAMGILWKFDPTTAQWSKLTGNPVPVHHGASAGIGRKMFCSAAFGCRTPESLAGTPWPMPGSSMTRRKAGRRCRRCRPLAARSRQWPWARRSMSSAAPAFRRGPTCPTGFMAAVRRSCCNQRGFRHRDQDMDGAAADADARSVITRLPRSTPRSMRSAAASVRVFPGDGRRTCR